MNDQPVVQFNDAGPVGCWIQDKFCSQAAPVSDDSACTDYPNLCNQPDIPLDLQFRTTTDLKRNVFWPQNYITDGGEGSLW